MKYSLKKTCNECKVFPDHPWKTTCELGIKVKAIPIMGGIFTKFKPLEKCYKPKTYSEYFEAKELC